MVFISKTYEIITKESAEQGDVEERGYKFESVPYSFRELIEEMRGYEERDFADWLTTYGNMDMYNGSYTNYSLHYDRDNKQRSQKYWDKALNYLKKKGK